MQVPWNKQIENIGRLSYKYLSERADILMQESIDINENWVSSMKKNIYCTLWNYHFQSFHNKWCMKIWFIWKWNAWQVHMYMQHIRYIYGIQTQTYSLFIDIKKSVSFLNTFLLKSICTLIKYYQNEKDKIFFKF